VQHAYRLVWLSNSECAVIVRAGEAANGVGPGLQLKLLMLGIWLIGAFRYAKPFTLALKSKAWPLTTAKVLTSSFDRNGMMYVPKIIYRYKISGQDFTDDTYTYMGDYATSKSAIQKTIKRFPEGSDISVHFDPSDPQQSVIVPGVHWVQYVNLAALTLILGSIAFIAEILNFIFPGCQPNCH